MEPITDEQLDTLTEKIIGCAINVHDALGPGLLESIYRDCLAIELRAANLRVLCEEHVGLNYRGQPVAEGLKSDLLVERQVIVAVKSVERLHPVQAQVITYLRLTRCPAGLLINFNAISVKAGLKRLEHLDRYVRGRKPGSTPPNNQDLLLSFSCEGTRIIARPCSGLAIRESSHRRSGDEEKLFWRMVNNVRMLSAT